jgi:hypothetical protein
VLAEKPKCLIHDPGGAPQLGFLKPLTPRVLDEFVIDCNASNDLPLTDERAKEAYLSCSTCSRPARTVSNEIVVSGSQTRDVKRGMRLPECRLVGRDFMHAPFPSRLNVHTAIKLVKITLNETNSPTRGCLKRSFAGRLAPGGRIGCVLIGGRPQEPRMSSTE